MTISKSEFGRLPDGTAADLFVLDNGAGLRLAVTNYGAIITSVRAPDRSGVSEEITLAYDSLQEYLPKHPYFGALVGRVANRISGGGFDLDGKHYTLQNNAGNLHLHGGFRGFDKQIYEAETEESSDALLVHFYRTSPDGEEGYPGALRLRHTVGITADMRLILEYHATSDAPTVVNLTNHTYWNLGEATIMDHELKLSVDHVVEVNGGIPTGRLIPVSGGPFDFSEWKTVRRDFERVLETGANGYDHCLVVSDTGATGSKLREAARVRSHHTGREMVVSTTYPGMQFYSGNNLPGSVGRQGQGLNGQEALCLECQFFPDAPNQPGFPSVVLRPGEKYLQRTEHRFTTFD